ncbi:PTS sugar transporter subunit IIA [Bacillaceae bacterium Marseille-Q3522]|nr:PTS sugar transporter subunit IIA [Bacillaceae bacterium Marseille-Q3522]
MKRKVLVITHGNFGKEIVKSVEMIMGSQTSATALALLPGESVQDLKSQAAQIVEENTLEGYETIVACDIYGGSPSNVAFFLLSKGVNYVLTGLNMPMLIQLFNSLHQEVSTEKLMNEVQNASSEGNRLIDSNFFNKKDKGE